MLKKLCSTVLSLVLFVALLIPTLTVCAADDTDREAKTGAKRVSPKEQVIYTDINKSSLGIKSWLDPDDGDDYFAWTRIDVADKDGFVCQAMVYVCRGSDRYTENFRKYLTELEDAYSKHKTFIAGYLDLWWDNRIRNWITYDFYGTEQVRITDPDGYSHEATIIAVCGSDKFMEHYDALYDQYLKGYEDTCK